MMKNSQRRRRRKRRTDTPNTIHHPAAHCIVAIPRKDKLPVMAAGSLSNSRSEEERNTVYPIRRVSASRNNVTRENWERITANAKRRVERDGWAQVETGWGGRVSVMGCEI